MNRAVVAGAGQHPAVRRKKETTNLIIALGRREQPLLSSRVRRPQTDAAVLSRSCDAPALRRERDRADGPLMGVWRHSFLAGSHVPEANRILGSPCGQGSAVRREGQDDGIPPAKQPMLRIDTLEFFTR